MDPSEGDTGGSFLYGIQTIAGGWGDERVYGRDAPGRKTYLSKHKSNRGNAEAIKPATHNNIKAIAAYMMAVVGLGDNPNPTLEDVRAILGAVSIQLTPHEAAQLDDFITDNAGRTVDEMTEAGMIVLNKPSGRSAAPGPVLEMAADAPMTMNDPGRRIFG